MKPYNWILLAITLLLFITNVSIAQPNQPDSNATEIEQVTIKSDYLDLTKSPTGAALRSLAFPGWGQLYVKHYIQAPVFFGAAGFLWFNIISNHVDYKNYEDQLAQYQDPDSYEYQVANSKMVAAVDNRDLSILYLLGVYVLSIVDAYAGAHLYDFKILNNNLHWQIGTNSHPLGSPNFLLKLSYTIN